MILQDYTNVMWYENVLFLLVKKSSTIKYYCSLLPIFIIERSDKF